MRIIRIILYTILCFLVYHYFLLSKVIDKRAEELGLLRYNSRVDKMVEKDSIFMSGYELHYLKYGSFKNYEGY